MARLYADGAFPTPSGRARFFLEAYRPVAERVDARYPLRLTTGRLRDQWHGLSRTGTVAELFGHVAEPRLGMSSVDLSRRALKSGDLVRLESRRGALHVIVEADDTLRSGQAYLPMHWGKRYLGGAPSHGVNTVTSRALDPLSRQPELKHAAVKVSAAPFLATPRCREASPALVDELQALQGDGIREHRVSPDSTIREFSSSGTDLGVFADSWLAALDAMLDLGGGDVLRYDDVRRARSRRIRLAGDRVIALRIAGEPSCIAAAESLAACLASGASVAAIRRLLLAPELHAVAAAMPPASPVVCRCHGVRADRIDQVLAQITGDERERLATLKRELACGTECGSCLPELRARIANVGPGAGRLVA